MRYLKQNISLFLANLLVPVTLLVFTAGFFRQPFRPDVLEDNTQLLRGNNVTTDAPFDKVVFMMVDALRSDFVYSTDSGFKFTQSLIRSGAAIPFTAHASPPSLTISRIKAMTTGSNPSFLDLFLNLLDSEVASNLADADTWLSRLKRKDNRTLVFYGENTWLQLFPDTFDRSDGVSSFFLPDFNSGDLNVTKKIPQELHKDDWSALVMHFPGMDHVGHTGGPHSPYMLPKQREMDAIVQKIFNAMEVEDHLKSTLLVVGGDHGMNDRGNHGGHSPGETSPALLFISPRFKSISKGLPSPTAPLASSRSFDYYTTIEQSDIVPTLAGLLGFPIPVNNLGVFIDDFLPLWQKDEERMQLLLRNSMQMMDVFKANNPASGEILNIEDLNCVYSDINKLPCMWQKIQNTVEASNSSMGEALPLLSAFCKQAQKITGLTTTNLDLRLLSYGIASAFGAVVFSLFAFFPGSTDGLIFGLLTALHGLTMFASRYVEEEHHFWFSSSLIWLGSLCFTRTARDSGVPIFFTLVLQFVTQCWNQSGDTQYKTADFIHECMRSYPLPFWLLVVAAYVATSMRLSSHLIKMSWRETAFIAGPAAASLSLIALAFKFVSTIKDSPELGAFAPGWLLEGAQRLDLALTARILWSGLITGFLSLLLHSIGASRDIKKEILGSIAEIISLYLMTQSRAKSIPLFLIFNFQLDELLFVQPSLTTPQIAITTLLMAQSAFFTFGNSNSIASIDLLNGYNGVVGYNALGVTVQVLVSIFAGPIWWTCGGFRLLFTSVGAENCGKSLINPHKVVSTNGATKASHAGRINGNSVLPVAAGSQIVHPEIAKEVKRAFFQFMALQTLFTTFSLFAVTVACIWLRKEPVIWTILAPKYVYAGLWSLFFHLPVNGVLGTVLWLIVE